MFLGGVMKCSRGCYAAVIAFVVSLTLSTSTRRAVAGQNGQKGTPAQTQSQSSPPKPATENSSRDIQTEKIETPAATSAPATLVSETGSLRPEEVAALLNNVHSTEYRIDDLLTDVNPNRWKLPQPTLESLNSTLNTLHTELGALEQWRAEFGQRTNSMYLGFQTYAAIDAVLPRLYGVASSVKDHENASYAAQFSQAGNQLFDYQQKIGAYIGSLLHSQDEQIVALDNNLASCQQTLTAEMRGKTERPTPMKNAKPIRPERRKRSATPNTRKKP